MTEEQEDIWQAFDRVLKEHGHPDMTPNEKLWDAFENMIINCTPEGEEPIEFYGQIKERRRIWKQISKIPFCSLSYEKLEDIIFKGLGAK